MIKSKRNSTRSSSDPEYIIFNDRDEVFIGLICGYPDFSKNIDQAKPLQGQSKFETLKKLYTYKLEQIFI